MIVRVGKFLFLGLLFGCLASLILSRFIWLEMRVNTSLSILILTVLGGIIGFLKNMHIKKKWFLSIEILVVVIFCFIYKDLGAFMVIPAIKFKEAFFLEFFTIPRVNALLLLLIVIGNAFWFIPPKNIN